MGGETINQNKKLNEMRWNGWQSVEGQSCVLCIESFARNYIVGKMEKKVSE